MSAAAPSVFAAVGGLTAIEDVARFGASSALTPAERGRVADAHARFQALRRAGARIYGASTGFGPLAAHAVAPDADDVDGVALQRGLIAHLAAGVGPSFPAADARAMMATRLRTLALGRSGARPDFVDAIVAYLDVGLAPVVPERGTVGASGDLTPLAHALLAVMGEGASTDSAGRPTTLAEAGAAPARLADRDGLAFVNGTAAMTGVAALALLRLDRLLTIAAAVVAALGEAVGARLEAWRAAPAALRGHPGVIAAAADLRRWADGGTGYIDGWLADGSDSAPDAPPQDVYSLRCAPQLLGAARDVVEHAGLVVAREVDGVSDNPILIGDDPGVAHGGAFMGQPVAFAADQARAAAIQTANLIERLVALVVDPQRPGGFPGFLTGGTPGRDSGLMGAQVTLTALTAELRAGAVMASVQSLSTNGGNQDVVSMGTIAARKLRDAVDDLRHVLAIAALTAAQAAALKARAGTPLTGAGAVALTALVRPISPPLDRDRPLSSEIEAVAAALDARDPLG